VADVRPRPGSGNLDPPPGGYALPLSRRIARNGAVIWDLALSFQAAQNGSSIRHPTLYGNAHYSAKMQMDGAGVAETRSGRDGLMAQAPTAAHHHATPLRKKTGKKSLSTKKDITGQRFGELTASHPGTKKRCWIYTCDQGHETERLYYNVKQTAACTACLVDRYTGDSNPQASHRYLYDLWRNIRKRCKTQEYANLTLHPEWAASYIRFKRDLLAQIGDRPSTRHSLDRIRNWQGYRPGNVRWATPTEQAQNRTNTRWFAYGSNIFTLREWAAIFADWTGNPITPERLDYFLKFFTLEMLIAGTHPLRRAPQELQQTVFDHEMKLADQAMGRLVPDGFKHHRDYVDAAMIGEVLDGAT
jgi:hypothetical protein